jgi:hypothetical protein
VRTVSAETYRERILHELRVEESKARTRMNQLIDMGGEDPETGQDYGSASDYVDGIHAAYMVVRRIPPSVQCLVRGHWKRQPCGHELQDRKWIQIEPYWRGPEDAPIAVRSHRVSS